MRTKMVSMKQAAAMAGENLKPVAWEIWAVKLGDGTKFTVSGETAAREWVKREGGKCWFTGDYETPSIT